MQVLSQDTNGAHDRLANIKVFGSLNDPVDDEVELPAEHLVQRLVLAWLGDAVPRQDQLGVGALEHWGQQSQRKIPITPDSYARLPNIKLEERLKSPFSEFKCCVFISHVGAKFLPKQLHSKRSTNMNLM